MSKSYALSGARVAYLCAGPHQLESLRLLSPPWAVSLPAQIAAVKALEDPITTRRNTRRRTTCDDNWLSVRAVEMGDYSRRHELCPVPFAREWS